MRHRADNNQKEIIKQLRQIPGCSVYVIGRPLDLLIGYRCRNFLVEVKNKSGKNKLTPAQEKFIPEWNGQVRIAHNIEEILKLIQFGVAS